MIYNNMFIISVDPAQVKDWTAIAVVDMDYEAERKRFEYDLIALARKQRLEYNLIVDWVVATYNNPKFHYHNFIEDKNGEPPILIIDAGGVGIAIRDMLAAKGLRVNAAITTTGAESYTREGRKFNVGKARLIGTFIGAYDNGKVHINPDLPMWPQLEREMLGFRAELSAQGRAKFEAKSGEHDDLLFALAQAVWYGEEVKRGKRLI